MAAVTGGGVYGSIEKAFHPDFGFEYEYRFNLLNPKIAIGFTGEMVIGDHTEYIASIPFYIYLPEHFKFWIAPSVLSISYPEVINPVEETEITYPIQELQSGSEIKIFFRLGLAYDYNVVDVHPDFMIIPHVKFDFIDDQVVMGAGIGFGMNFDFN